MLRRGRLGEKDARPAARDWKVAGTAAVLGRSRPAVPWRPWQRPRRETAAATDRHPPRPRWPPAGSPTPISSTQGRSPANLLVPRSGPRGWRVAPRGCAAPAPRFVPASLPNRRPRTPRHTSWPRRHSRNGFRSSSIASCVRHPGRGTGLPSAAPAPVAVRSVAVRPAPALADGRRRFRSSRRSPPGPATLPPGATAPGRRPPPGSSRSAPRQPACATAAS